MPAPKLPEGLPNAWLLDCQIFGEAIAPAPDLTVSEWADANRILTSEVSKEPGPWRTSRVPFAKGIMDELSPSCLTQEVTFVAGTQVTKTECGNNFIGFVVDHAPGPMMMVLPTSNTGKRTSKTRLARMIDSTPSLRAKISDHSRDGSNSAGMKDFPGGVLVIAGANSAAELKSMPVRYLFEDECDEYPDDVDGQGPADELAEKRTDTYSWKRKIYRASTPTKKGASKIWKHWLKSDQRRYQVPCPHCRALQVLNWEQMRWETRKVWEVVRADDGVIAEVPEGTEGSSLRDTGDLVDYWYECEACVGRIEEHQKTWMLDPANGAAWVRENPSSRTAGFHLPALYSPVGWYSWRTAIEKRLEADRDPTGSLLKLWTNTVLAEPYADAGESVSDLDVKERAADETLGTPYRRGFVPAGALLLTASVDVQANRLEVKVKGWGRDKESWLIDHQVLYGDTEMSSPWDQLDEYLGTKFDHEWAPAMRIIATAVDAGFRTQTVYDWCRPRTHRHIFPVKGQSQAGKTIIGRPTKQDIDHEGKKIPNGIDLWPIGTDTAKAEIYARLRISKSGPGCMHFPLGLPDDYYKQLTAERLVTKYVNGYAKRVWEKEATDRNEALDLEVMAYAAAIYAGLTRINWDRIEATLRAAAGDLFVHAQAAKELAGAEAASPGRGEGADAAPAPEGAVQTSGQPPARGWLSPRKGWLNR
jgi:phage terminase large subunit GpA-like protein